MRRLSKFFVSFFGLIMVDFFVSPYNNITMQYTYLHIIQVSMLTVGTTTKV
jgi:hypothetical protein